MVGVKEEGGEGAGGSVTGPRTNTPTLKAVRTGIMLLQRCSPWRLAHTLKRMAHSRIPFAFHQARHYRGTVAAQHSKKTCKPGRIRDS